MALPSLVSNIPLVSLVSLPSPSFLLFFRDTKDGKDGKAESYLSNIKFSEFLKHTRGVNDAIKGKSQEINPVCDDELNISYEKFRGF